MAASKFKQNQAEKQVADTKRLQEHELLESGRVSFWNSLREALKTQSFDFSNEPGISVVVNCDNSKPDALSLTRTDTGANITGKIGPDRKFAFTASGTPATSWNYEANLTEDGMRCCVTDHQGFVVTAEEAATHILERLLAI